MKRWIFFFLFLTLIIYPFKRVLADEPSQIIITVLSASSEGSEFDLDNDAYRDKLIKLFSYTSYHQITQKKVSLQKSEDETLSLPQNYKLLLSLKAKEKERIVVQAIIQKGGQKLLDTSLSILKPGTVFLGGPSFEKGVLVLVLEAVQ